MIPDLESHGVDLADIAPRHEVVGVRHPAMGHEKCSAEPELLQERSDEGAVRLHRIVEGEHHQLRGNLRRAEQRSGAGLKETSSPHNAQNQRLMITFCSV
jgi:hypothetical protein